MPALITRPTIVEAACKTGSPDHAEAYRQYSSTDLVCEQCHRLYYGQQCLDAHCLNSISGKPAGPDRPSICTLRHKCPDCCKLLCGRQEIHNHWCGHMQCRCCKEFEHKCFLQPEKNPEELRQECHERRRQQPPHARHGAAAGLHSRLRQQPIHC